jgi:integrase
MPYAEQRGEGSGKYYRARYRRGPGQSDGVVKDADGRTVRFAYKRDAQKAANDAEADYRAGRLLERVKEVEPPPEPPKPVTVGEWYTGTWRPAQEYDSINTEQAYDGHWKRYIEPRWGSTPLAEIRPIHLQAWENELRKRLSRSSVISIMAPFRRMLEDAAANRLIDYSPVPPPRRRSKKNRYQSKGVDVPLATWEQILARLWPEDALLARVIYFTGMRWSEVSAMRARFLTLTPARDGHPAAGSYHLHPDIGAVHEDVAGHRHYGSPKSGPGRDFDLPPFLVEMLIAHLATLPKPGRDVHPDDADLIFPDHAGRPHSESNWKKRWRRATDGREVASYARTVESDGWAPIWPGLRPHDGKHSHGARLDDAGTHRVMRDYRLGHDDGSTRAIYEHPTPAMRRKLIIDLQTLWETWQAESKLHSQATPSDLFGYAASEGVDIVGPGGTPQPSLF